MPPSPQNPVDRVFRAIADPTRRQILLLLTAKALTVGAICESFEVSQAAISQHMRVLRDAGLVESRSQWRHRVYHVTPQQLQQVLQWVQSFERFWDEALERLGELVEGEEQRDV